MDATRSAKKIAVWHWVWVVATLCLCGNPLFGQSGERSSAAAAPEFRAVWVDAFHAGIRTPQEADKLVEDAAAANFNALIVQVRRRGDSLYLHSIEPPLREAPYDPRFDALAYIIEKAHARGLEVHAWVNAMPIWRDAIPPTDANHVYNLHGPEKAGAASWLTASPDGVVRFPVGFFLDAGHPDAADHVARVCASIVRNYQVDGIHLDYIRYPETLEALPRGSAVGYNGVSLERFRRWAKHPITLYSPPPLTAPPVTQLPTVATATDATERITAVPPPPLPTVTITGPVPAPDDPQWIAWRRQQLTHLMRRVYIESKLANPKIKVSAAVIAWGKPPVDEKDFENVSPMQRIFQDWHSWLQEGILDMSLPMNYAREHNPVVREWFNGWIDWEKKHKHGRQMVIGVGSYMNRPQGTLAQIERIRSGQGKDRADGFSLYSYNSLVNREGENVQDTLSIQTLRDPVTRITGPFAVPAPIPALRAEKQNVGWLLGKVKRNGQPWDGGTISLKKSGWFQKTKTASTDGNGYFGATGLKAGKYRVWIDGVTPRKVDVQVTAGRASFVELAE